MSNRIDIFIDLSEHEDLGEQTDLISFLEEVLELEEAPQAELNIILTEDLLVRQLNAEFRNKDKTTDVLSFPMEDEPEFMGEVYISIPQVERQAPRFDTDFDNELKRVALHGILHILGYDHIDLKDRLEMRKKEEMYLERSIY